MQSKVGNVLQLFVVVEDLAKAISTYEEVYGIGPWSELDLSDEAVPEKWVGDQSCAYQVRIATCAALNVGISLVQPLDEKSDFARFLREQGPGIYHVLVEPAEGYGAMMELVRARGLPVLHRGITTQGVEYAHIDASSDLGMRFEMFRVPQ